MKLLTIALNAFDSRIRNESFDTNRDFFLSINEAQHEIKVSVFRGSKEVELAEIVVVVITYAERVRCKKTWLGYGLGGTWRPDSILRLAGCATFEHY